MLDERWGSDAADLAAALRQLLSKECPPDVVRATGQHPEGRSENVERVLEDFGIWSMPADAELLAVVAVELGRALAPVPFVEVASCSAILGTSRVAYGVGVDVPASVPRHVRRGVDGLEVATTTGPPRRTAADDFLVRPDVSAVGESVADEDAADRLWRMVRLLDAARLTGASQALLQMGVDYAKERVQFGRPIGSFQGVAHKLVDAAIATERASLLLRKACFVASEANGGDGAPSLPFAIMARAKAVRAARLVAVTVHQVLGGYGVTIEGNCQLYSRRVNSWAGRLGRIEPDLALLARTVLDARQRDTLRFMWNHEEGLPLPRWVVQAGG